MDETPAEAVRFVREQRKLSCRGLSLLAGLSPSYVNKFEHGEIQPSIGAFARIIVALGMNPNETYYCIRLAAEEEIHVEV